MKTNILFVFAVLFAITPRHSCAQKDNDKQALQGAWKVIGAHDQNDNGEFEQMFVGKAYKFDGETILVYEKNTKAEKAVFKMTYTMDVSKTPKEIDLYGYRGGKKLPVPILGVYGWEGERLRLTWSGGRNGTGRPTRLELDPMDKASRNITLLLERLKLEKK